MFFFNFPEHSFLILTVLKEARWTPLGIRARIDNAEDRDLILFAFLSISPDDSSACFIEIIFVTFIEDGFHGLSRKGDCNFGIFRPEHWRYSSCCRRRSPLGVRV